MFLSQELALSGFSGALVKPQQFPSRNSHLIWKSLLVLTIFLSSLVTLPRTEAFEATLTSDNLIKIVNQDRLRQGLQPLKTNPKLNDAALAKARHILENGYFAHTSPSGIKPWDFIKRQGIKYQFAGENLALNYTSAYDLENDFLKSPSHRENLLSPLFSEIGVGIVQGLYRGQKAIITVELFTSPL